MKSKLNQDLGANIYVSKYFHIHELEDLGLICLIGIHNFNYLF